MKWFGVLFIGAILADDMITFSSLSAAGGVWTDKLPIPAPPRKTASSRKKMLSRRFRIIQKSGCECGLPNTATRIVGGQDTGIQQYPWMAMLLYKKQFYCGGSLINSNHVLTAAHCVRGFSSPLITITLLAHRLDGSTSGTFNKPISEATTHPLYNPSTFDNDIALLKLKSSVAFDNILRPVCLPQSSADYAGQMGLVTGWGDTSENAHALPSVLNEVNVPILSNQQCSSLGLPITRNMICAGEEGKDSCQGDSGGPLHIPRRNKYQQIGIVSWGFGCARPEKPGVYTRVTNYLQWIKMTARDGSYCQ